MARKTLIQLTDDIDGTPMTDGAGRTVTFALEGTTYEIDLSDAHIADSTKHLRRTPPPAGVRDAGATALQEQLRPARPSSRRSASGPARTATRFPTAGVSRAPSATRTTPSTKSGSSRKSVSPETSTRPCAPETPPTRLSSWAPAAHEEQPQDPLRYVKTLCQIRAGLPDGNPNATRTNDT
jgi:hypothetical protein